MHIILEHISDKIRNKHLFMYLQLTLSISNFNILLTGFESSIFDEIICYHQVWIIHKFGYDNIGEILFKKFNNSL